MLLKVIYTKGTKKVGCNMIKHKIYQMSFAKAHTYYIMKAEMG